MSHWLQNRSWGWGKTGTQCWSHSYFPYETSLSTAVPPFWARLFPEDMARWRIKQRYDGGVRWKGQLWQAKEGKETAIGEKTNPVIERKAWVFVSVCHSAVWKCIQTPVYHCIFRNQNCWKEITNLNTLASSPLCKYQSSMRLYLLVLLSKGHWIV